MMAKRKFNKTMAEVGARNLAQWQKDHPEGGNLRHGAYSAHIRKRYSDKRTTEGRQLAIVIESLRQDIGPDLSVGQCLLLDRVREKLIVLMQIGKYADQQLSLINEKGELLPCLGRNYTSFSEALRRDIESLYTTGKKTPPPSYEKVMKTLEGSKQ